VGLPNREGDALKLKHRQLWTIAVGVGAIIVVALLVLVALGILVLPGTPAPAQVTVTEVQFTILQGGANSTGFGWFGQGTFNYSGVVNGYPFTVAPGGSFTVPVTLENFDNNSHVIYSVQAAGAFIFKGSTPTLPATVPALEDDAALIFAFVAPSNPGASLTLSVTINTLPPG
jgi:hypothetical protein